MLFSKFSIAQETETPLFEKNILSAGIGTELNIPLKSAYGTSYYFNASPLMNIDYTFMISNHYEYAFGINLNAELGERTIEYSTDNIEVETNNGVFFTPSNYYNLYRVREGDINFSLGLNYYKRLSSTRIVFFNLDINPVSYIFGYSWKSSYTSNQTGIEYTYWYDYDHHKGFDYPVMIQYKMGLILPNSHYKLMPFIELPLIHLVSSDRTFNIWYSSRNKLPDNPLLFFNISIGCNLIF